mmetsp:Transcript_4058/g.16995  ORF Transcript_4058/g.16995 Transcript_4058/m.16995 type:complete len:526 (+) Transcript_4058:250-1827(+)
MLPEPVAALLDQLDVRDEEPPRVRPANDEPLQQHAGQLLLDRVVASLLEEKQGCHGEEVRVGVGVAELVRNGAEQQVAPVRLEGVQQGAQEAKAGGRRHVDGRPAFAPHSANSDGEDERGHAAPGEAGARGPELLGRAAKEVGDGRRHRLRGLCGGQAGVQQLPELRRQALGRVADDAGRRRHGLQLIHLEGRGERVRQAHPVGERREDEIAQLHARGRQHLADPVVVVGQELGRVVHDAEHGAENPLVHHARGPRADAGAADHGEEAELVHEEAAQQRPARVCRSSDEAGQERTVGRERLPGEGEAGKARGAQAVQGVAEGREDVDAVAGGGGVDLGVGARQNDVVHQVGEEPQVGPLVEGAARASVCLGVEQQRAGRDVEDLGQRGQLVARGGRRLEQEHHQLGEGVHAEVRQAGARVARRGSLGAGSLGRHQRALGCAALHAQGDGYPDEALQRGVGLENLLLGEHLHVVVEHAVGGAAGGRLVPDLHPALQQLEDQGANFLRHLERGADLLALRARGSVSG